jgi:protein-S-isoprenylcysteine O-methyltransferase Ste14
MNLISAIILAASLVLWCIFHSALISTSVTNLAGKKLGSKFKFYRIAYNTFSFISLLFILWFASNHKGQELFSFQGMWQLIRFIVFIAGMYLLIAGAKAYDLLSFLGFRQIKEDISFKTLNNGELNTSGILSIIRHPWYTATFLILWIRDIHMANIIINVVFSVYLIIGCQLEEKKLIREFGDQYKDYQKSVSMLFPVKWIKSKFK